MKEKKTMSAKIISLINNKGGVSKTTSTVVFAELLAAIGCKVLVIDLDEQSNLSMTFHECDGDSEDVITGQRSPEKENICELFKYRYRDCAKIRSLIRPTYIPQIDIIPSSKRHNRTVLELTLNTGNNNIVLKRALKSVREDYDYILIDNAPASNILTVNSIFASDYIITPVRVEKFSLKGLKETLTSIVYIKEEHDIDNIKFLGSFLTQVDTGTNALDSGREMFNASLGDKIFKTSIRRDTKVNEANQDLSSLLNKQSNALLDYAHLLLEMHILSEAQTNLLQSCIVV